MNNPELPPHSQPAFSVRERAEANVRANPLEFAGMSQEAIQPRMIEIKKEINALLLAADQPPRYPLAFEKETATS